MLNKVVLLATKAKLIKVFRKQFEDFFEVYKESKDADIFMANIDEAIELLEQELQDYLESDEISLENGISALACLFLTLFLMTLEAKREEI